jgi:hypothetical protein
VTLIITQGGSGSYNATFGTDTSTTVKFPGGAPTLSTAVGAIDVVTVFNDGTNYLGILIRRLHSENSYAIIWQIMHIEITSGL